MISVVVCTYNRAGVLRRMLTAFFAQRDLDSTDHELIIVDNNSSDDTRAVVEQFNRSATLRYVFEQRQGLSCARNRAVAESRGEIVAFLDDDVIVDEHWLVKLQECFEATNADVVGGRGYLLFEQEPPNWFGPFFRSFLSEVDHGPTRKVIPDGRGLFGLNLAFRRRALQAAGPFDENLGRKGSGTLGGEETEIVTGIAASGGLIIYDPDAAVGHIIDSDRVEWDRIKRLAIGMGISLALSEPPAGVATRVRRVLASLGDLVYRIPSLCWVLAANKTPYDKRVYVSRMRQKLGFLIGRTKHMWHRG
ncbi:MAG: glycosyltransferase family 2 protein [Phycisphaerales bacterium]|nr:MAG: glycosyltransferase family 2 protein [Phycisphaerales bacterium]